ncbi:unnamed protein product [Didymodactylos carnosus]|uniref:NAD(+)--protein-arginine ADP-ribosyltransferase n=1 Tax=Didymodactylos carnosus TaxID=1234261 RepID=A0A8S2QST6_9BILA|nr:unnamed protein product [Didymodactylos carnosus]CAF4123696.1 unnamed protein product [Didymodactylos carnosus]
MAEENPIRHDRVRFLDVNKEPDVNLPPLPITTQILSLRDSVKNLHHLVTDLPSKVSYALDKCRNPKEGLTPDESAALYLYSLQSPEGQLSFYLMFNRALRDEDRSNLVPFTDYYSLFKAAMKKLPSIQDRVWRGVNGDLSKKYRPGTMHVWWGASSCTDIVKVTDTFLDKTTPRTLFNIKCYDGKSIRHHSYFERIHKNRHLFVLCHLRVFLLSSHGGLFHKSRRSFPHAPFPNESETILAPGTWLKVRSQSNPAENFHIIDCEQIEPEEQMNNVSVRCLMWLNPKVNNKSEENLRLQKKYREVWGKNFETYEKANECEAMVRQKKNNEIILIVTGRLGREIVPKIHELNQLSEIFVYCMNKEEHETWSKNYSKVSEFRKVEN